MIQRHSIAFVVRPLILK